MRQLTRRTAVANPSQGWLQRAELYMVGGAIIVIVVAYVATHYLGF
jgi:hypothetical protein